MLNGLWLGFFLTAAAAALGRWLLGGDVNGSRWKLGGFAHSGTHALVATLNGLPESASSLEALLRARGQRELAGAVSGR